MRTLPMIIAQEISVCKLDLESFRKSAVRRSSGKLSQRGRSRSGNKGERPQWLWTNEIHSPLCLQGQIYFLLKPAFPDSWTHSKYTFQTPKERPQQQASGIINTTHPHGPHFSLWKAVSRPLNPVPTYLTPSPAVSISKWWPQFLNWVNCFV